MLSIEIKTNGVVSTGVGIIREDMVMCGDHWWPGVDVEGFDDFTNEVIACGINEGGVLEDSIEPCEEGDPEVSWRVTHVTSQDLVRLRRDTALPPQGSVIRMASGRVLNVLPSGKMTDGEVEYASMCEIEPPFVVEVCHGSN